MKELGGIRILVVEDDAASRKLMSVLLGHAGACVTAVASAEEAVAAARDLRPAVVLTDVRLGGMSGLSLIERLESDPTTRAAVIVAVTGETGRMMEETLRAAGCAGCVGKPVDADQLVEMIEACLRAR